MVVCKCVFLDGKEVNITVDKEAKGSDLFDSICKYLGLEYRDPFWIVFRGGVGPAPYNWWIRPEKTLKAQIPGKCKVWEFAFIVKYYPKVLAGMDEEVARFHVIMQIRQDLLTGRLKCPSQTMAHLCSFWLQAQYGDWSSRHVDLQLADAFRYVQKGEEVASNAEGKSGIAFEEQMMQIHQAHEGMSTREADFRFIRLASSLPNYGIHYYPAYVPARQQQAKPPVIKRPLLSKDSKLTTQKLTIGIGPLGIHEYQKSGKEVVYTWKSMRAVSFKQNRIVLRMQGALRPNISQEDEKPAHPENQRNIVKEYFVADMYQTKIVWQVIIEYHMFFRMADQKGLKGEERKRLISSLKIKRTVPLVGEKKAEASPIPLSQKGTRSRSEKRTQPSQKTSPKRTSSVPVRRGSGQRSSSPATVPHKTQIRRSVDLDPVEIPPLPLSDYGNEEIGAESEGLPSSRYRSAQHHDELKSIATPASYVSTPRSGTFVFPPRSSRYQARSMSQNSISGDEVLEVLSNGTDNTDYLLSPNVVEKAFSFSEERGLDNVGRWQNSSTPRGRPLGGARDSEKISPNENTAPKETGEGRSGTPSPSRDDPGKLPIVIPAEILVADLKESRRLRAQGGDQSSSSSDFPMELDYLYKSRRSNYAKDAALMDAYYREFGKQSASQQRTERRAQSMHCLRATPKERDRSLRQGRSTSPKPPTHTPPIQRRTLQGGAAGHQRLVPEKRSFAERAYSESTLNHPGNSDKIVLADTSRTAKTLPRVAPTAKRRSHRGSERQNTPRHALNEGANVPMPSPSQRRLLEPSNKEIITRKDKQNTIPKIPIFIRSVV